jgi:hypothetical protein
VGSDSFLGTGFDLGYVPGLGDQIIPVPEPGVWFVGLVLLVGAIFHMVRQGACSKQMDPSPFYDKNADAGSETKNPIARVRAFFWVGNL